MIHDHQAEVVVVVDFPEFGGDAKVVITIARNELIAPDLVPLFGRFNSRRAERVDAQADRRTPRHCILHELHLLAVVSKEKRTRTFQTLLANDFLIGFYLKLGAHSAVGPNDANHIGTRLFTETEVKQWTGDRLLLHQQAGTDFHLAADAERS